MREEEAKEMDEPLPGSDEEDEVLPLPATIIDELDLVPPPVAAPPPTLTEALSNSRTSTPLSSKPSPVDRIYQQTTPIVRPITPLRSSLRAEQLSSTPDTDDESTSHLASLGKLLQQAPVPPIIVEEAEIAPAPLEQESDTTDTEGSSSSESSESSDESSNDEADYERGQVLYDFSGHNDREMSISAGQMVYILKRDNPQWWLVQNSEGTFGYVPHNFIKII